MATETSLQETFAMQQNPKSKRRWRRKRPGSETKERKKAENSKHETIDN
jgi:hypothetical protein